MAVRSLSQLICQIITSLVLLAVSHPTMFYGASEAIGFNGVFAGDAYVSGRRVGKHVCHHE